MSEPERRPPPASAEAAPRSENAREPLPSEALLQGRRVVEISHNGEIYRLQATRLGTLILSN